MVLTIIRLQAAIDEAVKSEREACAAICDDKHWPWHMGDTSGPMECAEAIRARSEGGAA